MNRFRKVLAGLKLATVSGLFWGTALVLGRIGLGWIAGGFGVSLGFIRLGSTFLVGAGVGFVGGLVFASAIALVPDRRNPQGLTTGRAALSGFLGGVVVYLLAWLGVSLLMGEGLLPFAFVPTAICGALGAATGVAILGTARRAELPDGTQDRKSLGA